MTTRYASRKFILTAAVTAAAIVALFTRFIDQMHFFWIVSLTLGMYKAANVMDGRAGGTTAQ